MLNILFVSGLLIINSCTEASKETTITDVKKPIQVSDTIKPRKTISNGTFKKLKLKKTFQHYKTKGANDSVTVQDPAINSPKSVRFTKDGSKFYINALEGCATIVYDAKSLQKLRSIKHEFNASNNSLFKNNENTIFDYKYKQTKPEYNHFLGKPVESCLSHDGKYLWVTYYRRDWDPKAESPSAIAIINTETDQIVRVMPCGPLPKMIACSGDNRYIAVTHWGDNTVGLIDISGSNPMEFKYVAHIIVDNRLSMNFSESADRDNDCGNCLRGTVFTPDSKKLLIAKMGGNGIAVIDVDTKKYIGTITGSYLNVRHLVVNQEYLVLSSNKFGFVQRAKLNDVLSESFNENNQIVFSKWETVNVGPGARTIDVTDDGRYIFACVNKACKVAIIDAASMKIISEIDAAPYPVGMALSPDNKQLITTSQGDDAVMVFEVDYEKNDN